MALTEAEQEHLAQVRAKMVLVMHQSLTFQQQADAILALTGDDGRPLLAVRHPEQTPPDSPYENSEGIILQWGQSEGWDEAIGRLGKTGWVRALEVKT